MNFYYSTGLGTLSWIVSGSRKRLALGVVDDDAPQIAEPMIRNIAAVESDYLVSAKQTAAVDGARGSHIEANLGASAGNEKRPFAGEAVKVEVSTIHHIDRGRQMMQTAHVTLLAGGHVDEHRHRATDVYGGVQFERDLHACEVAHRQRTKLRSIKPELIALVLPLTGFILRQFSLRSDQRSTHIFAVGVLGLGVRDGMHSMLMWLLASFKAIGLSTCLLYISLLLACTDGLMSLGVALASRKAK